MTSVTVHSARVSSSVELLLTHPLATVRYVTADGGELRPTILIMRVYLR